MVGSDGSTSSPAPPPRLRALESQAHSPSFPPQPLITFDRIAASGAPNSQSIALDWSYTVANSSSANISIGTPCAVPFLLHVYSAQANCMATASSIVTVMAPWSPGRSVQTGHFDATLPANCTYTFQVSTWPHDGSSRPLSPRPSDGGNRTICAWYSNKSSHFLASSMSGVSSPIAWTLQSGHSSDANSMDDSIVVFLGALGVISVIFVLRLVVLGVLMRQSNMDPFATIPSDNHPEVPPSPPRSPSRRNGVLKKSKSQSKRALKLIAAAVAESDGPPSPHLAMQIKLYNGDYHPEVEHMVKAIVAIEKQSQLELKNKNRSKMRDADVHGHDLTDDEREHTKHQAFVIHLHDGIEMHMLHLRKPSTKPTVVYANDNLTTIKWQVPRKPTPREFATGGAHTLHFVDVASIAPWTNALPPLYTAKYQHMLEAKSTDASASPRSGGPRPLFTVLVEYIHAKKRAKTKRLLIRAKDSDDQRLLVHTLTKLVASARKRRDGPPAVVEPQPPPISEPKATAPSTTPPAE